MERERALICVHVDEVELLIFGATLGRLLSRALIFVGAPLFEVPTLCKEVLLGRDNAAYRLNAGVRFLLGQQTVEFFQ